MVDTMLKSSPVFRHLEHLPRNILFRTRSCFVVLDLAILLHVSTTDLSIILTY
jgi:hypothetical protein